MSATVTKTQKCLNERVNAFPPSLLAQYRLSSAAIHSFIYKLNVTNIQLQVVKASSPLHADPDITELSLAVCSDSGFINGCHHNKIT